jgi:hypothetical protein
MSLSINSVLGKEIYSQHRRLFWSWLLVLVYTGGIFVVSAIPGHALPGFKISDKMLHAIEFGVLAVLLCRVLGMHMPTRSRRFVLAVSCLTAMGYGAVDEVHQLLVPQRMADFGDFVADSLGAMLGGWCWLWLGVRWPWLQ